jgi:hypothetical protein
MAKDNSWQHRASNRQTYASPYARYLKGFDLQNQFIKSDGEPDAEGNPTELYKFPEASAAPDRFWTVTRYIDEKIPTIKLEIIQGLVLPGVTASIKVTLSDKLTEPISLQIDTGVLRAAAIGIHYSITGGDASLTIAAGVLEQTIEFTHITEPYNLENTKVIRVFAPESELYTVFVDEADPSIDYGQSIVKIPLLVLWFAGLYRVCGLAAVPATDIFIARQAEYDAFVAILPLTADTNWQPTKSAINLLTGPDPFYTSLGIDIPPDHLSGTYTYEDHDRDNFIHYEFGWQIWSDEPFIVNGLPLTLQSNGWYYVIPYYKSWDPNPLAPPCDTVTGSDTHFYEPAQYFV